MSTKRHRDEDHYRSRETSRKKDERSERDYKKEIKKNYDRKFEKNYEKNQELPYRQNYEKTNNRGTNHERKGNNTREITNHKNSDRYPHYKSEKAEIEVSSDQKFTSTDQYKSEKPFVKEKVNFNKSGKLAEDTNMQNGVIVKYSEPIEAENPNKNWRLYPFKNEESLPFIPIHRKSYYLLGRDRKVVDIPLDHPSVSKQHAVIQFRKIEIEQYDGTKHKEIRPYLMDLESSNKTYLNNNEIDKLKYYQLLEKDVIKFGFSSREYVVLIDHENN